MVPCSVVVVKAKGDPDFSNVGAVYVGPCGMPLFALAPDDPIVLQCTPDLCVKFSQCADAVTWIAR